MTINGQYATHAPVLCVRARLSAEGLRGDELVLRWLVSHVAMPATAPAIHAAAEALAQGLPVDPAAVDRRVPA